MKLTHWKVGVVGALFAFIIPKTGLAQISIVGSAGMPPQPPTMVWACEAECFNIDSDDQENGTTINYGGATRSFAFDPQSAFEKLHWGCKYPNLMLRRKVTAIAHSSGRCDQYQSFQVVSQGSISFYPGLNIEVQRVKQQ